ncbi:hypothetical protein, partial [Cumulibacter manganitolerans]|uniref:hypothetical protein n=1 Tax=Cumulibacter manganitolerans TaxID=1884992 RepID=UPI001E6396AB
PARSTTKEKRPARRPKKNGPLDDQEESRSTTVRTGDIVGSRRLDVASASAPARSTTKEKRPARRPKKNGPLDDQENRPAQGAYLCSV